MRPARLDAAAPSLAQMIGGGIMRSANVEDRPDPSGRRSALSLGVGVRRGGFQGGDARECDGLAVGKLSDQRQAAAQGFDGPAQG